MRSCSNKNFIENAANLLQFNTILKFGPIYNCSSKTVSDTVSDLAV